MSGEDRIQAHVSFNSKVHVGEFFPYIVLTVFLGGGGNDDDDDDEEQHGTEGTVLDQELFFWLWY